MNVDEPFKIIDKNDPIFKDRNGKLFQWILEFIITQSLPARIKTNSLVLEDLAKETRYLGLDDLVKLIEVASTDAKPKKISISELEQHLNKGYYIIVTFNELAKYHKCHHGHDLDKPEFFDSKCRHTSVEILERMVPVFIVSKYR